MLKASEGQLCVAVARCRRQGPSWWSPEEMHKLPSESLTAWQTSRSAELDELEDAHRAVGGVERGRRTATQQINQGYAVLLSSQFQGFCRDLASEAADHLIDAITPVRLHETFQTAFTWRRDLDRGNPTPGAIGNDFNRFGMAFWNEVRAADRRNAGRHAKLEELNRWRNAIAHHDFDPRQLAGRTSLTLRMVQTWRSACNGLAASFDAVMHAHLQQLIGTAPW